MLTKYFLIFCLDCYRPNEDMDPVSPRESTSLTGGRGSRGTHLDPENEITRNRDFYRSHDVRPPFTYAALIRQVHNLYPLKLKIVILLDRTGVIGNY